MIPETLLSLPHDFLMRDLMLLPFALLAVWALNTKLLAKRYCFNWAGILPLIKQTAFGLVFAFSAILLCVFPGMLLGSFSPASVGFVPFQPLLNLTGLSATAYLANLLVFQTLFEELLFRALGLGLLACLFYWLCSFLNLALDQRLTAVNRQAILWFYCGTAANLTVSTAFAFAHRHNEFVTGIGLVNVMLAGLVIGQLFVLHRSIGSAWGFHFGWNFMLAFLGLPVSGYALVQPVLIGFSGAVGGLATGGAFGPEGALPTSVVLVAAFAMLIRHCWQRTVVPSQPSTDTSPT